MINHLFKPLAVLWVLVFPHLN